MKFSIQFFGKVFVSYCFFSISGQYITAQAFASSSTVVPAPTNSLNFFQALSSFQDCSVYFINFSDEPILSNQLHVTMFQLKYIGLPDVQPLIIPTNLSLNQSSDTMMIYLWQKEAYNRYKQIWISQTLLLSIARRQCKLILYYNPPSPMYKPGLYFDQDNNFYLKDPFFAHTYDSAPASSVTQAKTQPLYIFLVADDQRNNLETIPNYIINSVFGFEAKVMQKFSFWILNMQQKEFLVYCESCSPCKQFNFIKVLDFPASFQDREHISRLIVKKFIEFPQININTPNSIAPRHGNNMLRNSMVFLREIRKNRNDIELLYEDLHSHIISNIIPQNISIVYDVPYPNIWIPLYVSECKAPTLFHGALLPAIDQISREKLGSFPSEGLVIHQKRLRFVSCHKQQVSWLYQLQDLVACVDLSTWIGLAAVIFIVAATITKVNNFYLKILREQTTFPQFPARNTFDVGFQIFAVCLDQECRMFKRRYVTGNRFLWWTVFFLPLVFTVISNEYTGDNITRLTIPPPLVPFDRFYSLIKSDFNTYVLPHHLSEEDFNLYKNRENSENYEQPNYKPQNNHEAYPVVSELFKSFSLQLTETLFLKELTKRLARASKSYFQYSKLYPNWKDMMPFENKSLIENFVIPHLTACSKSAAILDENLALIIHSDLESLGNPAYLGFDVLHETLRGYKMRGRISRKMQSRVSSMPQTGITRWWNTILQRHITNSMSFKKEFESFKEKHGVGEQNILLNSNSHKFLAIGSILAAGFSLAAFMFVVLEVGLLPFVLSLKNKVIDIRRNKDKQRRVAIIKSYFQSKCFCIQQKIAFCELK